MCQIGSHMIYTVLYNVEWRRESQKFLNYQKDRRGCIWSSLSGASQIRWLTLRVEKGKNDWDEIKIERKCSQRDQNSCIFQQRWIYNKIQRSILWQRERVSLYSDGVCNWGRYDETDKSKCKSENKNQININLESSHWHLKRFKVSPWQKNPS